MLQFDLNRPGPPKPEIREPSMCQEFRSSQHGCRDLGIRVYAHQLPGTHSCLFDVAGPAVRKGGQHLARRLQGFRVKAFGCWLLGSWSK